ALQVKPAARALANDPQAAGDPPTAASIGTLAHGALTLTADGSFSYSPVAGYSGPDSFTYRANDGTADSNTATVSLTVSPTAPTDHPPVASAGPNQNATVGALVQVSGACTDVDGDRRTPRGSCRAQAAGGAPPPS